MGDRILLLWEQTVTWREYWDNIEEIFVGACLQFPIYFIVKWWAIPIMILSGLLWRAGGCANSSKLFRRIGVPLLITGSAFLATHHIGIFLAIPFMVWIAPSYGKESWLFRIIKDDFLTRLICFGWYWTFFSVFYAFG
jgi:hypothetical protein